MFTKAIQQLWPVSFLLPGFLALLIAFRGLPSQPWLQNWCTAYWWQLIFFGGLTYFAIGIFRWVWPKWGGRASRCDA